MRVFRCSNCNFRFQADEATKCPRCTSSDVTSFGKPEEKRETKSDLPSKAVTVPAQPRVFREGKEGWQDFHSQDTMRACFECGGTDFTLDYKRKEKTCKKCGAVFALPRRYA